MQPIKNWLVPSMVGSWTAGANRKLALLRIFLQKLFVQLQRFIYSISFFTAIFFYEPPHKRLALIN